MKWYLRAMKKYASFSGRARRMEFWLFNLFFLIFGFVALLIDSGLSISLKKNYFVDTYPTLLIFWLYILISIIPSYAVAVRRLHDVGESGFVLLLGFIPLIGIIPFIYCLKDSQPFTNKYGSNPKDTAQNIAKSTHPQPTPQKAVYQQQIGPNELMTEKLSMEKNDRLAELEKLITWRKEEKITQEEFEALKARIQ